jgi:uncharacterized protein
MTARAPTVWIDMLNSPNVLFCRPLIEELHGRGYGTCVTVRDFAQTRQMCELYGLRHVVIGTHGGAHLAGKAANLAARVGQLLAFARHMRPDVVLTHNSYSQLVAARMLGMPSVTSMDYEYQPANHLAFRCAGAVFVPEAFDEAALGKCGASPAKVWRYPGIKEEISLAGFVPSPGYRESLGVPDDRVLVVVRPPARFALYHRFDNLLFAAVLDHIIDVESAQVLILPRTPGQAEELLASRYAADVWVGEALDGPNLIAAADLVVSAGGSMVREAAALGTPGYSVYAGMLGGVDQALEREGRLTIVRVPADVARVRVVPRRNKTVRQVGKRLVTDFIDQAERAWGLQRR